MSFMKIEDQIIRATIQELLDAGFLVSVNDGEETTVVRSRYIDKIFQALRTTDQDYLYAHKPDEGNLIYGWVWLIHENGVDVISDHTVSLEPQISKIMAMIDEYEGN